MKLYQREFPDFPDFGFDPRDHGFDDESWHNNACPSFRRGNLVFWCDHEDRTQRDLGPESPRFLLVHVTDRTLETIWSTEDAGEANRLLSTVAAFRGAHKGERQ